MFSKDLNHSETTSVWPTTCKHQTPQYVEVMDKRHSYIVLLLLSIMLNRSVGQFISTGLPDHQVQVLLCRKLCSNEQYELL